MTSILKIEDMNKKREEMKEFLKSKNKVFKMGDDKNIFILIGKDKINNYNIGDKYYYDKEYIIVGKYDDCLYLKKVDIIEE